MVRIPLPWTEDVLLLTPPWGELRWSARGVMILLVGLAPAALVLLYRYELRLVRRSAALGLLTLRLAVLLSLLFLVCLRPIVGRTYTEELPGRVLVAVDRSESMDVADPRRPAVEKLRLARALKLAGDLCSDALLDDWIGQYETTGAIQWVADTKTPKDRANRDRLAEERQRKHEQVCKRIDGLTRTQIGKQVLAPDGLRLLETISARHRVDLLGFAQEAWDVKVDRLDELYRLGKDAKEPPEVAASLFSGTDLRLPLIQGLQRSGTNEEKILGIVLLTDGRHNWGPSPVAKAIELGQRSLPIYPIALGAREAPPDIALAGIKAPPAVFKEVDTQVEARVKVSGLPKQDLIVELTRPGLPALEERIQHDGTDRYHTVQFRVRLDQVGAQTLTVTARPVAGEIRTDNNSRPVVINVADDKAKVLLIDGEARWEYHYLANALARDRAIELSSVVFAQPRLGKIPEEDLRKIGLPALTLPADPDAFAGYDCIVLGDVSPAQLPVPERARLEKYVADRGGTLVIVAGKRAMPLGFVPAEGAAPHPFAEEETDPLLKLLPILEPRAVAPVKGFPITLTHEGQQAPFLQLEAASDRSLMRWADLPRHYWGIVGRAKPAATALAYLPEDALAGDRPDQGRHEKENASIVRQNYGFGRVLFVGLESTWRWRYKVGDTYHHRFWGQVIRWAAADKPLIGGNEHVRFGTRDPVYQQGQKVDLVVRLGDSVRLPGTGTLAGARIVRLTPGGKEEAVALAPLRRLEAQPRVLEGQVRELPAGQYAVELVIPELADKLVGPSPGPDGQPAKLRALFTVAPTDSEEMIELAANWPLLEELAVKSGGKVFRPDQAAELVELLTHKGQTRQHHTETRLWEWWPTLGLFLVLLTLEWVGRKWAGLP